MVPLRAGTTPFCQLGRTVIAVGVAGDRRRHRGAHLPRLRPRLGRLHARAVRRSAAGAVRFGLRRPARAVVRQSLHVRRRLRHARRARSPRCCRSTCSRRAAWSARAVGLDRAHRHLAHRPPHRRPTGRADRARAARDLPALLRAHVHEPEGRAVRGRDGAAAARARARVRGLSAARARARSCCSASGSA